MVDQAGIYTIELTNNGNNCVSNLSFELTENFAPPNANAGTDEEIDCENENALLTAVQGVDHLTPSWFDSNDILISTGEWTLEVTSPGTYNLVVFDNQNGCDQSDFAIVTIDNDAPTANAGLDVTMDCFNNIALIDASASTQGDQITYALFDNNGLLIQEGNSDSFSVNDIGNYQLIVTNTDNNCTGEDNVNVSIDAPLIAEISSINAFCFGQEGTLLIESNTGGTPPYLYSIDGGNSFQSSHVFSGLIAGTYDVVVQDVKGCVIETTTVLDQPEEIILILPELIEISLGNSILISPEINRDTSGLTFEWSNSTQLSCLDCQSPQFNATESQQLELTITDEAGCIIKAQILMIVDQRVPVYIPNVFSPYNGDGTNDLFIIYGNAPQIEQVNLLNIYDRWGNLMFSRKEFPVNDPNFGWDGKLNGEKLNAGVFVYTAEITLITGETVLFQGEIIILD